MMKRKQQDDKKVPGDAGHASRASRRTLLKTLCGATAAGMAGAFSLGSPEIAFAAALTKEERDKMTPDQIIESLKQGNERFRSAHLTRHDFPAQKRSSVTAQYPSTIILSCIDSRVPAEIVLDTGIGEAFVARVAGNVSNDDMLGSLEYACAVAGAKVIVVMGHTACGAVRGAIEKVQLGNLTRLLEKIKPAIEATSYTGERVGKNDAFVDMVAKSNVQQTMDQLRKGSQVLRDLEKSGKIKIVGAMYSLKGGRVDFW